MTDFGSYYPGVMRGVILGIDPDAKIVDITHSIKRGNIREGAFLLKDCIGYFPDGTIFVAVVDPGVGGDRAVLIVDCGSKVLVGPDNGLLIPAAKTMDYRVYRAVDERYFLKDVSKSFHGRDVFAPIAAHISKGVSIEDIGKPFDLFIDLELEKAIVCEYKIIGEVLFIDDFGNLITSISGNLLRKGDRIKVKDREMNLVSTYSDAKEGDLLAIAGSHGNLEISVNKGNAAEFLNFGEGDEVTVELVGVIEKYKCNICDSEER